MQECKMEAGCEHVGEWIDKFHKKNEEWKQQNLLVKELREKTSRLDQECIMAVVRNRSGESSGEIDMSLLVDRFSKLSEGCLKDVLVTLETLTSRTRERLIEIQECPGCRKNECSNCDECNPQKPNPDCVVCGGKGYTENGTSVRTDCWKCNIN